MNRRTRVWVGSSFVALLLAVPARADHSWNHTDAPQHADRTLGATIALRGSPCPFLGGIGIPNVAPLDEERTDPFDDLANSQLPRTIIRPAQLGTPPALVAPPRDTEPAELVIDESAIATEPVAFTVPSDEEPSMVRQALFLPVNESSEDSVHQTAAILEQLPDLRITADIREITVIGCSTTSVDEIACLVGELPVSSSAIFEVLSEPQIPAIPVAEIFRERCGFVIEPRQNLADYLYCSLPADEESELPDPTFVFGVLSGVGLVGLTRLRLF